MSILRKYFFIPLFFSLTLFAQNDLTPLVNPFIGTGGHGHTFPGAVLPFGMVQLSPDTRIDDSWDGCSGYHYSDSIIYGFSHTHLSGTGVSDYGDIMLMPMSTESALDKSVYSSTFSHRHERATPGFYQVELREENIKVELTVTLRTGIHRYTFPSTGKRAVILDLLHRDKLIGGIIKMRNDTMISGFRISEAWAKKQYVYFAIQFSQPITGSQFGETNKMINGGIFEFEPNKEPLLIKVGISQVSEEGAIANLKAEAPHWDFEKYRSTAEDIWNKQLSKIKVSGEDHNKQITFYTALYHCFIHPSLASDVDGNYRGRDNEIHTLSRGNEYTVFSLWDTYRALHPLFNILERERSHDFVNTLLNQYRQSGRLPVWELSSNETDCMIGYHSVSIIADALAKGIASIDKTAAFTAMKASASYTDYGVPAYCKKNYLDVEDEPESVSKTLEYAYDDWCIAQVALKLNKKEDYNYFIKKAQSYKNLYDPKTGFMRPRKNGGWLEPFDPREVNNNYTEGNSWQYSFYAPHDIGGLIALHGGKIKLEAKLDSLFHTSSKTTGREQSDITGLIGQYAHGNEPSHHMAYLYNFVGKPHKTQEILNKIMNNFYKNAPDGLIGNEDCGQMSAWYVFTALGFYPVCPGSTDYIIGKPFFNSAEINLEDGKIVVINQYPNTSSTKCVHSIKMGDNTSFDSFFPHDLLMKGTSMTYSFENSHTNSSQFGSAVHTPLTKIVVNPIVATPLIMSEGKSFKGTHTITIVPNGDFEKIVYTMDGKEPKPSSPEYKKPLVIEKTCTIKTKSYYYSDSSSTNTANFVERPHNWNIKLLTDYNKQYTAGGKEGMIDGIFGSTNWRKGDWAGYQSIDFECVLDFKINKSISAYSMNFLQDMRSWILYPKAVQLWTSKDGKNFTLMDEYTLEFDPKEEKITTKNIERKLKKAANVRYVKLVAKNYGTLPDWHLGAGGDAFIFVDEVDVK
jgi:predicted alpha-1,2-mannosidase